MNKTKRDLIEEKLTNFKKLLDEHIRYKENTYYVKMKDYGVDEVITFSNENIAYYKTLGMDTVVNSFFDYLDLDEENTELKEKITKYFNFFVEILGL